MEETRLQLLQRLRLTEQFADAILLGLVRDDEVHSDTALFPSGDFFEELSARVFLGLQTLVRELALLGI